MAERIPVPRFVGGTGTLRSGAASRERLINRFVESTQDLGGKVARYLRKREGIQPFAIVDDLDTGAFYYEDGACFSCTGTSFVQIYDDGTVIVRGTIAYSTTEKATMVGNGAAGSGIHPPGTAGHQIGIVSADHLYIYDTLSTVFTEVTDFGVNNIVPDSIEFMDGYFLVVARNSRRVYYSAIFNGLIFDFTFGYFERSWGADNISFIKRSGRQLWVVGTQTTEVYTDTGNATNPFAPIQGVFIEQGCVAKFTGQRDGETVSWLTQDERGGGLVVRASGYQPQQISTYPMAVYVQGERAGFLNRCEAFVHQIEGHRFYWLYVQHLATTPVFDFIEQEWTEYAMWNKAQGIFEPHVARCHVYAFEKHLVGVRDSGIIYQMTFDKLTDGV